MRIRSKRGGVSGESAELFHTPFPIRRHRSLCSTPCPPSFLYSTWTSCRLLLRPSFPFLVVCLPASLSFILLSIRKPQCRLRVLTSNHSPPFLGLEAGLGQRVLPLTHGYPPLHRFSSRHPPSTPPSLPPRRHQRVPIFEWKATKAGWWSWKRGKTRAYATPSRRFSHYISFHGPIVFLGLYLSIRNSTFGIPAARTGTGVRLV
ncbi:hypothetical protein FB451DRAFT_418164 [Mycena latifolia]|nr:hypothetical protein FB451DRAFT_418164 [Mycena latifolia]